MAQPHDLIPEQYLQRVCESLRALTHPQRLRICELLLRGECAVGELARQIGLKPNVVSQHLNHLRAYGIVRPARDGRVVYYHVTSPTPEWLLTCIRKHMNGRGTEPDSAEERTPRED